MKALIIGALAVGVLAVSACNDGGSSLNSGSVKDTEKLSGEVFLDSADLNYTKSSSFNSESLKSTNHLTGEVFLDSIESSYRVFFNNDKFYLVVEDTLLMHIYDVRTKKIVVLVN